MEKQDSASYLKRKAEFARQLTVFGRLTVLEALNESRIQPIKLHLATSNRQAELLDQIVKLAESRGADIAYHDRKVLSRISKNAKQDQGVALDLLPSGFRELERGECFQEEQGAEFIALDRITNPQNLGMIIRSVCASKLKGLILPRQGCAKLDALVIKASAGTLFRAPILRCDTLSEALASAKQHGANIVGLDLSAEQTLNNYKTNSTSVFVLGNESEGISAETRALCSHHIHIPMQNDVESLNVAITASLIALRHQICAS
jgi:23S rRNA (guanosine2251-2'-O)-methyltransferase